MIAPDSSSKNEIVQDSWPLHTGQQGPVALDFDKFIKEILLGNIVEITSPSMIDKRLGQALNVFAS